MINRLNRQVIYLLADLFWTFIISTVLAFVVTGALYGIMRLIVSLLL